MNVQNKLVYAKQHIESISRHHDAPKEEVLKALDEIDAHIKEERAKLDARRAAHAKAKAAEEERKRALRGEPPAAA